MNNFPFKQTKSGSVLLREFSADVNPTELVWHHDKRDRKVAVTTGSGWMLQMENKLPIMMKEGMTYFIPKNTYHRLLKGNSSLVLEIKEF
mgnify:CR=1 FL=1